MKKSLSPLAAVLLVAVAALLPVPAGAAAPAPKAQAEVLGPITTNGDSATMTVKYRCTEGDHLWVSAKQSPSGRPDQRLRLGESSQYAGAWLQSHRNAFVCDGAFHRGTFTVDKVEYGFGQLKKGQAWVQFCLTSGETLPISLATWVAVK